MRAPSSSLLGIDRRGSESEGNGKRKETLTTNLARSHRSRVSVPHPHFPSSRIASRVNVRRRVRENEILLITWRLAVLRALHPVAATSTGHRGADAVLFDSTLTSCETVQRTSVISTAWGSPCTTGLPGQSAALHHLLVIIL